MHYLYLMGFHAYSDLFTDKLWELWQPLYVADSLTDNSGICLRSDVERHPYGNFFLPRSKKANSQMKDQQLLFRSVREVRPQGKPITWTWVGGEYRELQQGVEKPQGAASVSLGTNTWKKTHPQMTNCLERLKNLRGLGRGVVSSSEFSQVLTLNIKGKSFCF